MLTSKFFTANRKKLSKSLGSDCFIVITAQSLLQRSGDTTYPFRQDSNFYYLTGINEPEVVLVVAGDEEFLILPKRSKVEDIFGGTINRDSIAKTSGIMTIYSHSHGWARYKELQKSRKKLYTLQSAASKIVKIDSYFTNPARRQLIQKLKRLSPKLEIVDIRGHLARMRQIKQPQEVAAIKKAIAITKLGFQSAQQLIKTGCGEYDIEAEFTRLFKQHLAEHAYSPIVAAGKNATILHYIQNLDKLKSGDFVLMDVGAEYSGYAADVTRTYCVGEPSLRQAAVYEAVKRVQAESMALLRPGLAWREYVLAVEQIMATELRELGLINGSSRSQVRRYFPHGISHSLGLDVHDVCDYDVIEEDMVITVEPGIYIPEEAIGVRIEDDILITKKGAQNLSSDIDY